MHPNPRRVVPIVVILLLCIAAYFLYTDGRLPFVSAAADSNLASGFIEGREFQIASELAGRIAALHAAEGERVSAGQVLVELDHALLDAQAAQAQAAVDAAQAQLAQVKQPARPEEIAAAQAALQAAQENYRRALEGATEPELAAARAAVQAAQENYDKLRAGPTASDLAAAQAALDAARKAYDKVRAGPTPEDLAPLKAAVDNARAALDAAQAAYDRIGGASNPFIGQTPQAVQLQQATNNYNAAVAAYTNALTHPTAAELAAAEAQVEQAQAALDRLTPTAERLAAAEAQLKQAQAALDRLTPKSEQLAAAKAQVEQAQAALSRLTPTPEMIAIAESQLKQAEAALAVVKVQLDKTRITSPADGIITRRAANVGEVATPGAVLLSLSQLDPVELTIYVPVTRLGSIQLGGTMEVMVDAFPGRTFQGTVIYISPEAEFTPRNVQTKEERVNIVFAVKLQIPNPNLELKAGMPADARLAP